MEIKPFNIIDFIKNPTGIGTSYFGNRDVMKTELQKKYTAIKDDIKLSVFSTSKNYIFKFKIPSSSLKGILYDVVFLLYPETRELQNDDNIKRYNMKFFSNMPSFTFTYANIMKENKMLINFLMPKISKQALRDKAVIKNPAGVLGFEKSTYLSALYLSYNRRYFDKKFLDKVAKKFNISYFEDDIQSSDEIMKKYKIEKQRLAKLNKDEKETIKLKNIGKSDSPSSYKHSSTPISKVNHVKKKTANAKNKSINVLRKR